MKVDEAAAKTQNQIYFNGQLLATHDQDDYVRLLFKDHLDSTRSVATVTPLPGWQWGYEGETTAVFSYNPYGDYASSWIWDSQIPKVRFTGKERESNGLDYFSARYYESTRTHRWMSADSLTARVYDPLSLNKYSFVRNDPINLVDPDGRFERPWWMVVSMYDAAHEFDEGEIDPNAQGDPLNDEIGAGVGGAGISEADQLKFKLVQYEKQWAAKMAASENCAQFLSAIIAAMKADQAPLISSDFSLDQLVANLNAAAISVVNTNAYHAHTQMGTNGIQLGNPYFTGDSTGPGGEIQFDYGGTQASTLLHQAFHLASTSLSGNGILDSQLKKFTAMAGGVDLNSEEYKRADPSEWNRQMFSRNCGQQ